MLGVTIRVGIFDGVFEVEQEYFFFGQGSFVDPQFVQDAFEPFYPSGEDAGAVGKGEGGIVGDVDPAAASAFALGQPVDVGVGVGAMPDDRKMDPSIAFKVGRDAGVVFFVVFKNLGGYGFAVGVDADVEHMGAVAVFPFGKQALLEDGVLFGFDVEADGEVGGVEGLVDEAGEFDKVLLAVQQQPVVFDATPAGGMPVEDAVGTVAALVAGVAVVERVVGDEAEGKVGAVFQEVLRKRKAAKQQGHQQGYRLHRFRFAD